MAISELLIQSTLKVCIDPNTGKDFISSKSAKNIQINGNDVSVDIVLGYPAIQPVGNLPSNFQSFAILIRSPKGGCE